MTTEEKLKELVLTRYGSIREFIMRTDLSYSTFDSMLRRGINTSSVHNVLKVCQELNISADALAIGEIKPILKTKKKKDDDIQDILSLARYEIVENTKPTFSGVPISSDDKISVLYMIDGILDFLKRKTQ